MNTQSQTQPPQVGRITSNLLYALRTLEQSREYYARAIEETQGKDGPGVPDADNDAFDAVRDLIARHIESRVLSWSNSVYEDEPV